MEGVTIIVRAIERGWHLALALDVSTRMCRFLPLIFLPCGSMQAPFFRAFHALAIDDRDGRTGFPLRLFATVLTERVVDPFQCAVIGPQIEVVVDRAFRRQVFRARAPLTAMRPFTTSRMITVRLPPPVLPGGISGRNVSMTLKHLVSLV